MHTDKAHRHVHAVVNRVDPETGVAAKPGETVRLGAPQGYVPLPRSLPPAVGCAGREPRGRGK